MVTEARADVYTRITNEIIAAIEAGANNWTLPWHHNGTDVARPQNVVSHRRYRGINVLALWIAANGHGYASGVWGTYRQWASVGAQVRKGERGTTVVLWKEANTAANDDQDDGEEVGRRKVFARAFTVFNVAQVDNYEPEPVALLPELDRIVHAEAFVDALRIPIVTGPYDAHYRIDLDKIFMPPFEVFEDAVSHIGTLVHEAAHATGAKHRLDRNFEERFRRDSLAIEEIVALRQVTSWPILALPITRVPITRRMLFPGSRS